MKKKERKREGGQGEEREVRKKEGRRKKRQSREERREEKGFVHMSQGVRSPLFSISNCKNSLSFMPNKVSWLLIWANGFLGSLI